MIYGRNMWEESLNAYTYDTYSQEFRELYLWIENVDSTGTALIEDGTQDGLLLQGVNCMETAAEAGVSCVLLPGRLKEAAVETLAKIWGGSALKLDSYYILTR